MNQVPLLYEVPVGSMEAYRAAVESEHARSEEVRDGCGEAGGVLCSGCCSLGEVGSMQAAVNGGLGWRQGLLRVAAGVMWSGPAVGRGGLKHPSSYLVCGVQEYERRRAEAEALAAEAADDASAGGDGRYAKLSNDGGSQEDEPAMFMAGVAMIARKKRKKILKTSSIGSRGEGSALQGSPPAVQGGDWGDCA